MESKTSGRHEKWWRRHEAKPLRVTGVVDITDVNMCIQVSTCIWEGRGSVFQPQLLSHDNCHKKGYYDTSRRFIRSLALQEYYGTQSQNACGCSWQCPICQCWLKFNMLWVRVRERERACNGSESKFRVVWQTHLHENMKTMPTLENPKFSSGYIISPTHIDVRCSLFIQELISRACKVTERHLIAMQENPSVGTFHSNVPETISTTSLSHPYSPSTCTE